MLSVKSLLTFLLGASVFIGMITLSFLNSQMFIDELMVIGFILGCLTFLRVATSRK